MTHSITGIILSGGKSLRMGRNKAFIQIEGVPIIERICSVLKNLFREIIIVTDQGDLFGYLQVRTCADLLPGRGALGGLYTGLYYASFRYSFCVGCDMPFLSEPLIGFLLSQLGDEDLLVPRTADGLQPLHAFYSKTCLEPVRELLDGGGYKIIDFYPRVRSRMIAEEEFLFLDPARKSFINVNTPEELLLLDRNKSIGDGPLDRSRR